MPPEPIPHYLNALSVACGALGILYAAQAFLPKPEQILQDILRAIPYGVVSGAALYCLNILTNAYYTHILTEVYSIPITSVALGIYVGMFGFIGAYAIAYVVSARRQGPAPESWAWLALLAAGSSVISSWFAFGVINLKFHWFSGILAIIIGAALVLINAIARFIQQYSRFASRQGLRQSLHHLTEAQVEDAEPLDDDEDPIEGDEEPSTLRFRAPVRQQANLPTRLYGIGRFAIGIIALYASVSLFGFGIVLYPLALSLGLIAALLVVLALQRRVIARLSKSALAILSVLLLVMAIAGQIFRVI